MQTAVVVIDMVKDSLELSRHEQTAAQGKAIVPAVNRLTAGARERGWPVVFSTDSFMKGDFLFGGRMGEHSIRGTEGAEVSGLLDFKDGDHWLPKRRLSAFFKTDLDQSLRLWGVDRVAVCGLMTPFCVLATAIDAICNDFRAVLVEDACNAQRDDIHSQCLDTYRKTAIWPLLTVQTVGEVLEQG